MELSRDDGILLSCNKEFFHCIAVVELFIFQSLGWSPGFSHGSHTPNRGVDEADATLPLAYADFAQTIVRSN